MRLLVLSRKIPVIYVYINKIVNRKQIEINERSFRTRLHSISNKKVNYLI